MSFCERTGFHQIAWFSWLILCVFGMSFTFHIQPWSNVNRLFGLSQLYNYQPPHNTRSDAFHPHSSSYHDHITQN